LRWKAIISKDISWRGSTSKRSKSGAKFVVKKKLIRNKQSNKERMENEPLTPTDAGEKFGNGGNIRKILQRGKGAI